MRPHWSVFCRSRCRVCAHPPDAEQTSLVALNISEPSLRTFLNPLSSVSSSETMDKFAAQVVLAHTTTFRLYPSLKRTSTDVEYDEVAMQSYLKTVRPAWCALMNTINVDSPQRWRLFLAILVDICQSRCPTCIDIQTRYWGLSSLSVCNARTCRLPALECFRRLEQTEADAADRGKQVVGAVEAWTQWPFVLACLLASYEVDSSLRYTVLTIEKGYSA